MTSNGSKPTDDRNRMSDSAKQAVALNFNPSGRSGVTLFKILAAEFITLCEDVRNSDRYSSGAKRNVSIAITDMESACMRAVKAATFDLDD